MELEQMKDQMKTRIKASLIWMQGEMSSIDPTTGGLCRLYNVMPDPLKTHVSFPELVKEYFGMDVGVDWFSETTDGSVVFTLRTDIKTQIQEIEMRNLYLNYVNDPYGDHPLGHARFKLVNDLLETLSRHQEI